MDINSHVSQKEMKNLVWFALLAIKTISCDLSLATLKENNEIINALLLFSSLVFQWPRYVPIIFQFPLAIKAEWSSGG